MRRFLRDNGLTIFFLLAFLLALAGQAVAGQAVFNDRQIVDGGSPVSLAEYVTSSDFAVDVAENWQSEYLQFLLYILATVWLVQRGSTESKPVEKAGEESDADQRTGAHTVDGSPRWARGYGWRRTLYSNSLGLTMGVIFLLSWLGQSVAGLAAYNGDRLSQLRDPVDWASYAGSAEFWSRTLQNWQSEMLAVASMVALSIYLRQRSSPESKPVGAPHDATGAEG
ncbi:hypothetical protein Misp01_65560 [Microtetraspora sp. NBRC 13810]|uniref:DUF6766 family protein n=1 Tax=Microtetraspora sp. NBRC 13810 TaxID=3030990 RepID=UPI0024A3172B|nr:DUF6766 family protein [Microtetraspora sp. NBRC 13810]GLW11428.1 hypothetical protein Misp01_65560 [Microtetraspora sp. NBRC 13810]